MLRKPIHREMRPVSSGFMIGWTIFRITIWATIVVWLDPRALKWVGGEGIGHWLIEHWWVRVLGALPLGLLAIISAFEILNDPGKHAARQTIADTVGGTLVTLQDLDPNLGIPDGPGVRVPVGRWSMTVGTWRSGGKVRTVARVSVATRSTFSFLARGPERDPEVVQGLQQFVVRHSMPRIAGEAGGVSSAMVAATFAYLAESPITVGSETIDRAVVLRTNQPDTARDVFTSAAVVSGLTALNATTRRWDWSYYPSENAGTAEMRLELPGSLKDAEALRVLRSAIDAALGEMECAGQIAA